MEKRIENAIDIFLDALNEGTLAKGDCTACAVGNIVRHGMGLTREQYNLNTLELDHKNDEYINWSMLFSTQYGGHQERDSNSELLLEKYSVIKKQINSTEFDIDELAMIEYAFETNTKIMFTEYYNHTKEEVRADQIKGLEAVVKVMLTFNKDTKTDVKKVFTNKAELIAI